MNARDECAVFCENIRLLRQKHNLSKKDMAKILEISVHSLSMIERGILPTKLSCEVLFCILDYFNTPIRTLFVPMEP